MATYIGGILCEEIVAGFEEHFHLIDGPSAKKGFLCPWADRFAVANGVLGLNTAVTVGSFITVQVPLRYPQIQYVYAYQISIQPVGAPSQGTYQIQWPYAIVWVDYKATPWSFSGIDDQNNQIDPTKPYIYATQKLNSSSEWITVPGRFAEFKTSGVSTGVDYGFRIANVDMEITLHRLPYLPTSQALNYAGMINDSVFLGVNVGKLLFNGMETTRTKNTDGTSTTEATFKFTARAQRWDYGFDGQANGGNGGWDQIVWPDHSTPFIQSTDLSVVMPSAYAY